MFEPLLPPPSHVNEGSRGEDSADDELNLARVTLMECCLDVLCRATEFGLRRFIELLLKFLFFSLFIYLTIRKLR